MYACVSFGDLITTCPPQTAFNDRKKMSDLQGNQCQQLYNNNNNRYSIKEERIPVRNRIFDNRNTRF